MEKCDSGMEQWTQQTAVAGEIFRFRRHPREGDWPEAMLERVNSLELRAVMYGLTSI